MRTFLEVYKTRHFGRAAENLYVTQSAVSARIKLLEEKLGVRVLSRERNNVKLTPAGQKLLRYAETMVTTWHRARQEIAVADEARIPLSIGCSPSLWEVYVREWVGRLHRQQPGVLLTVEPHDREVLVRRVLEHTLDIAVTLEATRFEGLVTTVVRRIRLILVASQPRLSVEEAIAERYILVDWGTRHSRAHAEQFPDLPTPAIRFGHGSMARDYLLEFGGAAYLAEPSVGADLKQGRLHRVRNAPVVVREAIAMYATDNERRAVIEQALRLLKAGRTAAKRRPR